MENRLAQSPGNTRLTGLYCPVSAHLDVATLESLLSKLGVRGIAVPKVEEPKVASVPPSRHPSPESLATLVTTGDIKGLRRVAAKDFDPDTVIPFRHPRFAGGRLVRRPILVAAALFGRTEIVVFLLNKGASTDGRSSQAICPAAAIGHLKIVEVLLRKNPKLKDVERCGRSGNLAPADLARRRGHHDGLKAAYEALHGRVGKPSRVDFASIDTMAKSAVVEVANPKRHQRHKRCGRFLENRMAASFPTRGLAGIPREP